MVGKIHRLIFGVKHMDDDVEVTKYFIRSSRGDLVIDRYMQIEEVPPPLFSS